MELSTKLRSGGFDPSSSFTLGTSARAYAQPALPTLTKRLILAGKKFAPCMQESTENGTEKSKERAGTQTGFAKALWPRLVEAWIFLAIFTFFVIRVLGSHTVQRFLGGSARPHP